LTPKLDDELPTRGNLDIGSLSIGPSEARVLSCVDGQATREEIASLLGSSPERISEILQHLAELGAVRFDRSGSAPPSLRPSPSPTARSGAYRIGPQREPSASVPTRPPGAASSASPSGVPTAAHELEQRKRALARKLGHSSLPPAPASSPTPRAATSSAASAPPSRYENENRLRNQQLEHYVGLADAAIEKQELVSACNFLKLACSLAPHDLKLADRLKALELRAATELWVSYAERAQREALNGEWAAAARSYERAALGHPNGTLLERVAYCLLEAKGEVKRAGEFAQRAVALAPQDARCRITLARCYAAAKLRANALVELERARALAPELPEVKDWIRRIGAGEF
jgi:hypothetical protein